MADSIKRLGKIQGYQVYKWVLIDLHTLLSEWKSAIITPIFKKGPLAQPTMAPSPLLVHVVKSSRVSLPQTPSIFLTLTN